MTETGWLVTLSRAGMNEDGDYCTTAQTFKVTYEELLSFEPTYLVLPL